MSRRRPVGLMPVLLLVIPLVLGAGAGTWEGPPRLVEVLPEGQRLNGVAVTPEALAYERRLPREWNRDARR